MSSGTNTSAGSSVAVSGLSGSVQSMSLTFNNLNVTNLNSLAIVLVAPDGQAFDLLSGVCGVSPTDIGSSTFTLADSGSSYLATVGGTCPATYSGTYLPTDYYPTSDIFDSPGPGTNYASAGNPNARGSDTFLSVFGATVPNGTWTLYIANQAPSGVQTPSGTLGSWTLSFVITGNTNVSTTTSLSAGATETTLNSAVTLTATVTPSPIGGTVTFTDNGTNLVCSNGANPIPLSASSAICTTSFSSQGVHPLIATFNGSSGYSGSSNSNSPVNLLVDHTTTASGAQYCNNGGISIPGSEGGSNLPASPYPSRIDVTGYSGNITGATLTLNNFADADPQTTAILLVGPTGTNIVPWDNVGGTTSVNLSTITLADSAGSTNTIPSPPVTGETYYPTASIGSAPAFPAGFSPWGPPATIQLGPPPGQAGQTFTNAFNGINPNGYWSLYLYNTAGSTALSAGSWCLNLLSQSAMNVGVSNNPATFTQGDTADTYTITVKNVGTVPTSGELTLSDSLPSGMSPVSFSQSGGTDWSCSGTSCTRTTAMSVNETDTLILTVSVGWTTSTGTDTNIVTVSGGNLSGTVTGSKTTSVNAGQVNVTFDTAPTNLTYSVNGSQFSGSTQQTLTNGSAVTLTTTTPQTLSSLQYAFTGWSDGGPISHTATISSTNGTATYTANFSTAYTLTTAANPSAGGSISPASGTYGGTVSLTASPNSGWAFTSWTGPVASSTSASTTITMSGNESATANFAPNAQTTVWIVNSIGGLSELTGTGVPATTTPYTGGNTAVAIDATGNLWTVNSSSPLLYETNQLGTVQTSISSGGLNAPVSLAIDGAGQVWVVNGNDSISLFSNTGTSLAPSGGFTDTTSFSAPSSIAIDQSGSVWIANKTGNSLTRILGAAAPAAPLSRAAANNTTGVRP